MKLTESEKALVIAGYMAGYDDCYHYYQSGDSINTLNEAEEWVNNAIENNNLQSLFNMIINRKD